jgi:hypothetical protein
VSKPLLYICESCHLPSSVRISASLYVRVFCSGEIS